MLVNANISAPNRLKSAPRSSPHTPHRGAAHWRTARAVVRQCLR